MKKIDLPIRNGFFFFWKEPIRNGLNHHQKISHFNNGKYNQKENNDFPFHEQ